MVAPVLHTVKTRLRPLAYRTFGMLPPGVRRALVSVLAPSFTVGALAILHDDGLILFVRQLHRTGLALPGGLLQKGENPLFSLRRELSEEVGLGDLELSHTPDTAFVDPGTRRVDLIWFAGVDRTCIEVRTGNEVLSYEWRAVDDGDLTPETHEILAGIGGRLPL